MLRRMAEPTITFGTTVPLAGFQAMLRRLFASVDSVWNKGVPLAGFQAMLRREGVKGGNKIIVGSARWISSHVEAGAGHRQAGAVGGSARWISSHVEADSIYSQHDSLPLFRSLDFKPC